MKLYTYFRSSASFRVRIALALKGLAPEQAHVSLVKGEHGADAYRAVNPQALVPALEDDGRTLIQSLAIMEYLEEQYPEPPLLPRGALDRAYVRAVSQIIACEIHPLNNLRTLKHIRRTYGLDEDGVNTWYRHWIADGLAMLERYLAAEKRAGRYAFGDTPDHGRLLHRPADLQRAALRLRRIALQAHHGDLRRVHEARRIRVRAADEAAGRDAVSRLPEVFGPPARNRTGLERTRGAPLVNPPSLRFLGAAGPPARNRTGI